jgi:hypothetical protein
MQWHTVKLVLDPPHDINLTGAEWWNHDRGMTIRIGEMISRAEAVRRNYFLNHDGCECDQFFQCHPDDAEKLAGGRGKKKPLFFCRAYLEMD